MLKKMVVVMMLVVIMFSVCGCQASKGLFEDVSGTSAWVAEKLEKPAEDAAERDADRAAKKLEKRQAILSYRVARNGVQ